MSYDAIVDVVVNDYWVQAVDEKEWHQWRNFGQKSGGYKISFPSPFPFPSPFSPSHSTRPHWTSLDSEHTTTTIEGFSGITR